MWIGNDYGGIRTQIFFDGNIVDLEIVVAQGESFIHDLADIDLGALRFSLACKGKQILHHTMGALSLLEELGNEILSALIQAFALEQLSVTENRGERIIEFMGDSGNELADGGHLLALQELLLSAP